MEIIVGESAGFCYGVKRAVEGTFEALKNASGEKIFCFGELVHNKAVTNKLKEDGATFIEDINDAQDVLVVRAHGIRKDDYEYLERKNTKFIDYTCPNVLKIHKIAEEYAQNGYYIFLLGDKNHPENIGTISFCGQNSCILDSLDEVITTLEDIRNAGVKKLLIIAQTTYSVEKFNNIINVINSKAKNDMEVIVKNTICNATNIRQSETEKISKEVDCMIIIRWKK